MTTPTRSTRVGVLGRGQLGRMLELAGRPLGARFEFAAEGEELRGAVDVLTFESETVAVDTLVRTARGAAVRPCPRALLHGQDRERQKELFARVGVATAPWEPVDGARTLRARARRLGLPAVLKLRRGGYDGRGQWTVRDHVDLARAERELGERPAVLERLVSFRRELSVLAVRSASGERAFYPLSENHHEAGCLRVTLAPAEVDDALRRAAEDMVTALLEELDYVGVLALELFEVRDPVYGDRLLANEIAPRVHNSGHWTIEGAETSQFENHLRAISGLPLGSTRALAPCAMVNLIGTLPPAGAVLAVPGAHLHVYGKEPRPGRKLGHVTLRAESTDVLRRRLVDLAASTGVVLPDAVAAWTRSSSCA